MFSVHVKSYSVPGVVAVQLERSCLSSCVLLYKLLVVHVLHPLVSVNSFRPCSQPAERPPVRPGLARIEHAQRLHIWVRMEALYSHMKSKNGRES